MAIIKAVGSTTYTTIPDGTVEAALNENINNNIVKIGNVQYQLNTLIMGGQGSASYVQSIGTIDYTEVNAAPANPTYVKTFAGVIPAGKILTRLYAKVTAFVSASLVDMVQSALDSSLEVASANVYSQTQDLYYGGIGSSALKMGVAGDVTVTTAFAGAVNNPQDYTSGSVEIFCEFIDAPTL